MEKQKHFNVKGFLNFSCEAEIHAIPKTLEKWISKVRKKYGKTKAFQIQIYVSDNAEIHAVSKTLEKLILIIRKKYGKKQTFESYGFLKYFEWVSTVREQYEKIKTF